MKPNILWICTDQQRFDSLGCYGNQKIDTPNIDRLAEEGVLFQNVYCQSPVCSPSRASFLTGRYPRTCRVRQNGQKIPETERLVSKLFADSGYTCGLSGKLHIAPCHPSVSPSSEPRIDDGYHVFHWSHHPDFYGKKESNWPLNEYNIWLSEQGEAYKRIPYENSKYVFVGMDRHLSQSKWCAHNAISFINAHSAYARPWFFSLNFYDPHHDFDPPRDLLEKYLQRVDESDLPDYEAEEWRQKPYVQQRDHKGAYDTPGFFDFDQMTDQDHLQVKAAYYAMVELIDREVGRVIHALRASGQYENTIVIFTSDHGEMLGDHGIYLKGPYFYDPLVKVPLIITWPGRILEGKEREALTELLDLAPTLLDLANLDPYPGMQGKSLKKLLTEKDAPDHHRDAVYSEYYNSMGNHQDLKAYLTMVADRRYKMVYCHSSSQGELYDRETDPGEHTNLYCRSEMTKVRLSMLETMTNKMAFTIDPLPDREAIY